MEEKKRRPTTIVPPFPQDSTLAKRLYLLERSCPFIVNGIIDVMVANTSVFCDARTGALGVRSVVRSVLADESALERITKWLHGQTKAKVGKEGQLRIGHQ